MQGVGWSGTVFTDNSRKPASRRKVVQHLYPDPVVSDSNAAEHYTNFVSFNFLSSLSLEQKLTHL